MYVMKDWWWRPSWNTRWRPCDVIDNGTIAFVSARNMGLDAIIRSMCAVVLKKGTIMSILERIYHFEYIYDSSENPLWLPYICFNLVPNSVKLKVMCHSVNICCDIMHSSSIFILQHSSWISHVYFGKLMMAAILESKMAAMWHYRE